MKRRFENPNCFPENPELDAVLWYRPFIPVWLDDFGLKPSEFRVFCHVLRRASGNNGHGCCTEAVPKIAAHCKLHEKTVRRSLQELVKRGVLKRQERYNQTTIYWVVPSWKVWKNGEHPTVDSRNL